MAPWPHVFVTLSLPPDFFTSFSSLELISSTRQGTTAIYGTTAPHGSSKRELLHGTTAVRLLKTPRRHRLLKTPRRHGSSRHHDGAVPPRCGLLHGTGYSTTRADDVVALQGTMVARPDDGAISQGTTAVWLLKRRGLLQIAPVRAPPRQRRRGPMTAGLDPCSGVFLFLKINVWCQLTTPKFKLLVQPSSIILDFLYLINRSADTKNRLPTDKKCFFVVVILC
jgi:hypothetical protein